MKIKNKLALTYTGVTAAVLIILSLFIYYFFAAYTKDDFFNRLYERAQIVAQIHLEKDELSNQIYEDILSKYLLVLPDEEEYVLRIGTNSTEVNELIRTLGKQFFENILIYEDARLEQKDKSWVGIRYEDNQGDFIVLVAAEDQRGIDKLLRLRDILIIGVVMTIALMFGLGRWYASQTLKPIANITHSVNNITTSNLHLRLPNSKGKDELSELSATFNEMLDRLETSFQIQNNFISNASHELKNPLTAILGETEFALDKVRENIEYVQSLRVINKEAMRLEQLTLNLLQLAQTSFDATGIVMENVRIDEVLFDLQQGLYSGNPACRISVNFNTNIVKPSQMQVRGSTGMLKIALKNLLENACKFSDNNPVHLHLSMQDQTLIIEITDMGIGIPAWELKNIFEPFYRASNARKYRGFGIGLPLTERIISLHKGKIEVESKPDVQTVFRVKLPLTSIPDYH